MFTYTRVYKDIAVGSLLTEYKQRCSYVLPHSV